MSLTHPSPNHSDRKGQKVDLIVLHCDASKSEKGTLSWIQSAESKVSYHVVIGRDGSVYTCVPFDRMAWHAGKSEWNGRKHCNLYSVGLSFSNRNDGQEPITDAQKTAMKAVIADLRQKYGPLPITTHTLICTPKGRKSDPEAVPNFQLTDFV